ncbi:MAG: hypothetical protein HRU19_32315 [Pseudobacteriovorax sp.]|nr:hypothetical protein [Pseudobacteriovorax sp.]
MNGFIRIACSLVMLNACVTKNPNEISYHYEGPLNITAKPIDQKFDEDYTACKNAVMREAAAKQDVVFKNAKFDKCMSKKDWNIEYAGL